MNFKEILELIDKVAERGIAVVEVERSGMKVRIEGKTVQHAIHQAAPAAGEVRSEIPLFAPAHSAATGGSTGGPAQPVPSEEGLHIITSPIVGTFYRAPNPESEAFVNAGDRISKGKVLCIVEAMKLMNEIESDIEGVVEKIYPQNGQPIEYGEKLFAVRI